LKAKDLIDNDVFGESEDSDGVDQSDEVAQPFYLQKSRRASRILSTDLKMGLNYRKLSSQSRQLSANFKLADKSRNLSSVSRNQSTDFTSERRSSNMSKRRSSNNYVKKSKH